VSPHYDVINGLGPFSNNDGNDARLLQYIQ